MYEILFADDLNINNEHELFEIIIKWIEYEPERKKYMKLLLKTIRFGFINKKYFIEKVRTHKYIQESEELISFLNECSKYILYNFNTKVVIKKNQFKITFFLYFEKYLLVNFVLRRPV